LLTDPARQIWNSFNNRANAGDADAPEAAVNGCLYDRFKSLYNKTATKPSLVIVPARFKSGTLYSQIPSSNADFTVTRPLNTATRFNSSALIQTGITSGVPRLDYYTSGGVTGCPALLVEPAATNLLFHSEVWTSGNNWTFADGVTSVSASITAPDNTQAVNALSPTSANSSHFFYSNNPTTITYTSGTIYTQSIFFKQGTGAAGRYVQLTYPNARFTQLGFANFDLQDGVVTASGGTADTNRNARIENYGNGWYRCIFAATCNSTGAGVGVLPTLITTSGATRFPTFLGVTGDVLYGWGAQVETGSAATSYIPTTTGSVTRNADIISVSGAVSGAIGQQQGTIYMEVDVRNLGFAREFISVQDSSYAINAFRIESDSANSWRVQIRAANSSVLDQIISSPKFTTGIYKIAFAYNNAASGVVFAVNGTVIYTSASALTMPTGVDRVILGTRLTSGSFDLFFNDRIRAAALYTTRLTNDELQSLTQT
jgi:hypothetical protein